VTTAEDNVDIVRRAFKGFQRLDLDAFTADWAPDITWDLTGYEGWPGAHTTYTGEHEVVAEFAQYLGSARSLEVTDHEITPLDDGRVLGTHRERRVNEGEETPTDLVIEALYTFDKGKITHVAVYTGHGEARKAAGRTS
jgi:ketosteroid isomerase-like protein